MTETYYRKNRLEVSTERHGNKTVIAIESDIMPPVEMLKEIIRITGNIDNHE